MASLLAASAKRRLPMFMSCYARLSSSTRYFERREGENLGKTRKIYAPHKDLERPADRPRGWILEPCISETKYNEPQIKVVSQLLNAKTSPREEKLQQDDTIPSPIPISGNGPEIKVVSQLLTAEASPTKEKLQQDDTIPSPIPISGNGPEIKVVSQLLTAEASPTKEKLQQDDTIPSPIPISGNGPEIKDVSQLLTAEASPIKEKLQQDDTIPSPEPISEMTHEPSNANQATGKKRKTVKKEVESVLINALERNNELLRAQLEDQKSSFQLAREEHKEQHERLVATLTKITGVLEKIADKL
ncbi:uncharacterized protein LOC130987968 isoform X2 [Salvia miltiorrhiza]|uniref:uncharacterized protein LOC130987968 isoform X2 n=1 Tax=Salvia miltiorrhiza TaxID=226208 RepID=UPI0025AC00D5|nr:uncharacterized protein LOC130987968 isoform X2 [Salvia miltiorrhiza]